jgi:hypothetical protein
MPTQPIEYDVLLKRLRTFREEIARSLAESDLEHLTLRHFLIKNKLATEKEIIAIRDGIRKKRFAKLEKENLIRIQVVHEDR